MSLIGKEIDLLINYPKPKRNLEQRKNEKTEEDRKIARKFDKEFFDGDRKHGYGGFNYNPKFWTDVIPTFCNYYKLKDGARILDVGCAKGFMLYDFLKFNHTFEIRGIDISTYAIMHAKEEVKDYLDIGCASNLPYEDNSFDLVISINTVHNLEEKNCAISLKEIQRVTKKNSFITVDAYNNEEEKERMFNWNLTGKTIFSTDDWKKFFEKNQFYGDYYWFIP